jgi:cytochrome bd ubiquinol oxidase subunit II
VVRGVPLDRAGTFFLPLWTDFSAGPDAGILDWYTILVGVLAFVTLAQHGALWLVHKTEDILEERARGVARIAWYFVTGLTLIVTGATPRIQPQVSRNLSEHPWGVVFPALAILGLLGVAIFLHRGDSLKAFLSSCAFIAGMLTSAAFGVFPNVLPSNTDPALSLTIANTAAAPYGLKVALVWWIPGMLLVAAYSTFIYRHFAGKVQSEGEGY